jgi:hypothetical protein
VDSTGNTIFAKWYETNLNLAQLWSTTLLRDGNLISVGKARAGTYHSVILMKTTLSGDLIWSKQYDIGEESNGYAVRENSYKDLIVTGVAGDESDSTGKILFLKTDSIGNTVFTKKIGNNRTQKAKNLLIDNNDNIFIFGTHIVWQQLTQYAAIVKISSSGNIIWTKKYLNLTWGGRGVFAFANEIAFTGYTTEFGAGNTDTYLAKTDVNGGQTCDIELITYSMTNISSTTTPLTFTVMQDQTTVDVSLSVTGGGYITTKCEDIDITGTKEVSSDGHLSIYPNPANDFVKFNSSGYNTAHLIITNSQGKLMLENEIKNNTGIDVLNLTPGIYFTEITTTEGHTIFKFIKE